jgi:hypothetical protein
MFLVSQAVLASNGVMIHEWWIEKGLEGSCHCLIELLTLHLLEDIEEIHEKHESE